MFRTISDFRMIHQMVAQIYEIQYGRLFPAYPKQRLDAEIVARSVPGRSEVTMDMIYEKLTEYSSEEKIRLKAIEEKCEIDNCVPNHPMIDILRWCRQQGKMIVITTDMYLSRNTIQAILSKLDIDYDYLFVSGEEGVTKRTGKLFSAVLRKLNIQPSQMIHIGDDFNNDIAMPRTKGIASLERLVDEKKTIAYIRPKQYKSSLAGNHLLSLLSEYNSQHSTLTVEQRIGYIVLGPLLTDFCQWLHHIKREKKLQKLFFVAREGFLIQKIYETLYPEEIASLVYIRLNKNLLRLPLLSLDNPYDNFMKAKLGRLTYDWKLIFDLLYIQDYDLAKETIRTCLGFSKFERPVFFKDLEAGKFNHILALLFEMQKDKIAEQASLLDEYLKSLGLYEGSIGFVNNSINGNGQAMLTAYSSSRGRAIDILGLQFMKTPSCEKLLKGMCCAWLTESGMPEYAKKKFHSTCLLLEHLMFEPQGTSLYFYKEEDIVKVKCEIPCTEQKDFKKIAAIQQYALQFADDYVHHVALPLNMAGFYGYFNMLAYPLYEDAQLLCNLNDHDADGDKLISDPALPFHHKYLISRRIPFNIAWPEGYFVLKQVSKRGMNLYGTLQKWRCYKSTIKQAIKNNMKL